MAHKAFADTCRSNYGPVHLAYNPSLFSLFFQPEQYFSLTKNQPTVFFSRLIIPAERLLPLVPFVF
jgi:hypothetical protein